MSEKPFHNPRVTEAVVSNTYNDMPFGKPAAELCKLSPTEAMNIIRATMHGLSAADEPEKAVAAWMKELWGLNWKTEEKLYSVAIAYYTLGAAEAWFEFRRRATQVSKETQGMSSPGWGAG